MTVTDLGNGEDYPFLILACDGVWDVFSDQEAVDLILERYLVEGSYENAAELLVSMLVVCSLTMIGGCICITFVNVYVGGAVD